LTKSDAVVHNISGDLIQIQQYTRVSLKRTHNAKHSQSADSTD